MQRASCDSEIYHVFSRGTAKSILFEADEDRRFFMRFLRQQIREFEIECQAWCLMDNHFHLLLHGKLNLISSIMRNVCAGYVKYFNQKYARVGALFQGRFKSVPIESSEQLLTVARYIHFNPVKAGHPLDYTWSSFREYARKPYFSSISIVLNAAGSREEFLAFHAEEHVDVEEPSRAHEFELMKRALGEISPLTIQGLRRDERNRLLRTLKESGFSVRQIERATGISRNIIQRAK